MAFRTKGLPGSAVILACSAVLLTGGVAWKRWLHHPSDDPWRSLEASLGTTRTIEPRVTGLEHRPWTPNAGSRSGEPRPDSPRLRLAVAALEVGAIEPASAADVARAGAGRLLLGDAKGAVALLERAATLDAGNAAIHSDLAAAYLARSTESGGEDAVRGLNAALRAVALDEDTPAGWFNLALSFERIHLAPQAVRAWQRAAALESGGWHDEALNRSTAGRIPSRTERLTSLAALWLARNPAADAAAAMEPDLASEVLERTLLKRWAQAVLKSDRSAEDLHAGRSQRLASVIARTTGDAYYPELIRSLLERGQAVRLAEDWLDFVNAIEDWDSDRLGAAAAAFDRAGNASRLRQTPARLWLDVYRAASARLDGQSGISGALLGEVRNAARQRGYRTLQGRSEWQLGLLAGEAGRFGRALEHFDEAIMIFATVRDRESAAVVHALLATYYAQLEDQDRAWEHQLRALEALPSARRIRRDPVLSSAAFLASSQDLHGAAVVLREPLVIEAREAGSAVGLAFLLAEQALDLDATGRHAEAVGAAREADKALASIDDPGTVDMARAIQRAAEAHLVAAASPAKAVALWAEAIDIHKRRRNQFPVPALQIERGRTLLGLGRLAEAEAALRSGLAIAEAQRRGTSAEQDRISLHEARWSLRALLTQLVLERDGPDAALRTLEQGRAINLTEHLAEASVDPLRVVLPDRTLVVAYAVLGSQIVAWARSSERVHQYRVDLDSATLASLVARYREGIESRHDEDDLRRQSGRLFTALLGPVRELLPGADRLVLVPDGALHDLPFATLRDPANGRLLIENSAVVVAPNISFGLAAARPRAPSSLLRALVVGNPAPGAGEASALPRLRAAGQEAAAVARLYPSGRVLLDRTATRPAILEGLRGATVVHFAGHAIANTSRPDLSRLLLAPSPGDSSGALFASDIDTLPLDDARLVVLAACETAKGRVARGEGIMSLTRAFLASGVPSVIATLWQVEDAPAKQLFVGLHAAWAQGYDSAEALRRAQLAMARQEQSRLADWGAVVMVGKPVTR